MMCLIKPKKKNNNQYYADNHLGKRSKEQYCWMRNKNKEQYLRSLSEDYRFWVGLLAILSTALSRPILLESY
jgi:hypothetical protein